MNSSATHDLSAVPTNENTDFGRNVSSSNSNRNAAIMNGEIQPEQLMAELKEIKEDVKFLKFMMCTVYKFPTTVGTSRIEERKNDRICMMKQLFQSDAALSRFIMHVTVLQLLNSELPLRFDESHSKCPSLVLAALLFSREGNLPLRVVRSTSEGKLHLFLKRAVVGNAFLHMKKDKVIRWLDSSSKKRGVSTEEEDVELSKMGISPKLTEFVYHNACIMPIPKPTWINVKKEDLLYGAYVAETSAADRQDLERRKRMRTSELPNNDADDSIGIEDSSVLALEKQCDQFKVSLVKIGLQVTTSFLIKSRRYVKKEAMESGLYLLHKSLQATVGGREGQSECNSDLLANNYCGNLPLFQKAYGCSQESVEIYDANEKKFMHLCQNEPALQLEVNFNAMVDGEKRRVSKVLSSVEMGKDILCALLHTKERHLFVHYPNVLKTIYYIAAWIRTLFLKCLSPSASNRYGSSGFPEVKVGHLDLTSFIPRQEDVRSILERKTVMSKEEYSHFCTNSTSEEIQIVSEQLRNEDGCDDLLGSELGVTLMEM